MLNLNVEIKQNKKVILKLKTKLINKEEINTFTFNLKVGKRNNVVPSISS